MKLDFFRVVKFKNLIDFAFDFDEAGSGLVTVLLGQNGSGKSNLLEALVVVFRDLYLEAVTGFEYELRYTMDGGRTRVAITNRTTSSVDSSFSCTIETPDGARVVTRAELRRVGQSHWLPRHVFAYYSGPSDRLETHFREHQRRFSADLLAGKERPFRPLFYARPVHSQFVLLAFFTGSDPLLRQFLEDRLGILELESVLFVMRKPSWARKQDFGRVGDQRFWGARGVVAAFLDRLFESSLAPLRVNARVAAKGTERPKAHEYLYLFVKDQEALRRLASPGQPTTEFFKELESTYISELIEQVRIRVKVKNCDGSLTFRELSEGEQQLLTVVGLLRFTREEDALFLLDEPDTHLNPAWGMEYLTVLRDIAEPGSDSQVLMATHDPLVLSGLKRNEVVVMERNQHTGRVEAFRPQVDPEGLGVVGILRSEMFGLRTTLDLPTQHKLDRRLQLVAKGSERNAQEDEELRELSDTLASLGFAHEFRDANFDRYARAIGRVRHANAVTLTRQENRELDQEAAEIIAKILAEQSA